MVEWLLDMANNFAGIATFPFQGVTYRLPVKLPQGVAVPANQVPPSICPVSIDWNVYWQLAGNPVNVGVAVNLQAASVQASILDRIASVKIDNTGSNCSVYVQFPDTGDVINCPPNCSVTFPCLTNLLNANVFALGLEAGFIPTTRIFFYNIVLPPAVDYEVNQSVALWKASPAISRGTTIFNENYGTPSLGDQIQASIPLNVAAASNTQLWGTPYESGFIYLKALQINIIGLSANTLQVGEMAILSTGAGGILIAPTYAAGAGFVNSGVINLLTLTGMDVKLDATQTWKAVIAIEMVGADGEIQVISVFTQSPI
jgi:hypothetical protein